MVSLCRTLGSGDALEQKDSGAHCTAQNAGPGEDDEDDEDGGQSQPDDDDEDEEADDEESSEETWQCKPSPRGA